jgi:hypothetical protein
LKGFILDLSHGKSAVDSLADALRNLADRLLNLALDNIFGRLFGGGFGGGFGRAGLFHEGGMVGAVGPSRMVSPLAFAGAPRLHSGAMLGLGHNDVPAILEKGEIVIPRLMVRQLANGAARAGPSIIQNVTYVVPGGIDSPRSQNQLAAKSAAALQRAARIM